MKENPTRRQTLSFRETLPWPPKWEAINEAKFGQLTVVAFSSSKTSFGQSQVVCLCTCGWYVDVPPFRLRGGNTTSCGCVFKASLRQRNSDRATHKMIGTPEYRAWQAIKNRCLNSNDDRYKWYGARGITVCDHWIESFENFYVDVGPRPSRQYTIERRDNNRGYSPDNVYWATSIEQNRNLRTTKLYTLSGQAKPLGAWVDEYKVSHDLVYQRVEVFGWSLLDALTVPPSGGGSRRSDTSKTEQDYLYGAWLGMIGRCHKPSYQRYADYGGRGIVVNPRWQASFEEFQNDVGPRPSLQHSLDRRDNDGNYEPDNVRWATSKEQNRNRRSTKRYELYGEERTLSEWAELAGVAYERVKQRVVTYKWPLAEALGTPISGGGRMAKADRKVWTELGHLK